MHGELIIHCQMSKSTDTSRILSILSGGRICSLRGDYLSAETSVDVFMAAPNGNVLNMITVKVCYISRL